MSEHDLSTLISAMDPVLSESEYAFCSVEPGQYEFLKELCLMQFRETEGITYIIPREDAERELIHYTYPCRLITLNVHSSLEAVGFLAEITKYLALAGISVNAVSAFHHDHLFVPTDKADLALTILSALAAGESSDES